MLSPARRQDQRFAYPWSSTRGPGADQPRRRALIDLFVPLPEGIGPEEGGLPERKSRHPGALARRPHHIEQRADVGLCFA